MGGREGESVYSRNKGPHFYISYHVVLPVTWVFIASRFSTFVSDLVSVGLFWVQNS